MRLCLKAEMKGVLVWNNNSVEVGCRRAAVGELSIYGGVTALFISFIRSGERVAKRSITSLTASPFEYVTRARRKIDAKCDKWKTIFYCQTRPRYATVDLLQLDSRTRRRRRRGRFPSYHVFLYPARLPACSYFVSLQKPYIYSPPLFCSQQNYSPRPGKI